MTIQVPMMSGILKKNRILLCFSFARKQAAKARRLHFWSIKFMEGEDKRAQQVDEELLC
jgi:hypothetical protein